MVMTTVRCIVHTPMTEGRSVVSVRWKIGRIARVTTMVKEGLPVLMAIGRSTLTTGENVAMAIARIITIALIRGASMGIILTMAEKTVRTVRVISKVEKRVAMEEVLRAVRNVRVLLTIIRMRNTA